MTTAQLPQPSEKLVLAACLGLLRKMRGVIITRTNAGTAIRKKKGGGEYYIQLCDKDWPDITGQLYGRAFVVEVKAPGKKLMPGQEDFKKRWTALGGIHITAWDVHVLQGEVETISRGLIGGEDEAQAHHA